MAHLEKIIILVDMDCFYCQVEEQLDPNLAGKPIAVVQYNAWKGGGIIAVNYPAKKRGVTRHMRGKEAKKKCPEIQLVSVPTSRGKADISKYRDAGKRVADVLLTFTPLLERASVDEAYLDVTNLVETRISNNYQINRDDLKNTHVVGSDMNEYFNALNCDFNEHDFKLAVGAAIAEEIRMSVFNATGYKCSAGIAHNKILAKLAAGMHKPNQQTILPQTGINQLYQNLPVHKITGLGGKFGLYLADDLGIKMMSDLYKFSETELQQKCDVKAGSWLYNIARGINLEPVVVRLVSKSIGCCKKFPGPTALTTLEELQHWINDLSLELFERLSKDFDENNRKAKNLVVTFTYDVNKRNVTNSRTHPLTCYETSKIIEGVFDVINKNCIKGFEKFKIKYLGISATKFENCKTSVDISTFFKTQIKKDTKSIPSTSNNEQVMNLIMEAKGGENESVYSKSTKSSSENEDFIYLDESYHCNDECDKTERKSENEEDRDSITSETFYQQDAKELDESSFFDKYFMDRNNSSTIRRDFDTSRHLENMECSDSEELGPSNINESKTDELQQESVSELPENEKCPECNKLILKSEILIHMDHHYALKLSKEVSNSNQTIKIQEKSNSKTKGKIGKKKQSNICPVITTFLKTKSIENNDVVTEICKECNKKIALQEFTNHMDYHAAKKLHLELNPIKTYSPQAISKSKKQSKYKTVNSFFKPM